jgi:hypothetical protein
MKEIIVDKGKYTNIIIYLSQDEREQLIKRLEEISMEGGQFSWGYAVQKGEKNVIYFRKVNLNGEIAMYSDLSLSKRLLATVVILLFFLFMGILFIISLLT